jgi:hypothetical protein
VSGNGEIGGDTSGVTQRLMMRVMSAGWLRERPLVLDGMPVQTLPTVYLPLSETRTASIQTPERPQRRRAGMFWRRQRSLQLKRTPVRVQNSMAVHLHLNMNLHLNNSQVVNGHRTSLHVETAKSQPPRRMHQLPNLHMKGVREVTKRTTIVSRGKPALVHYRTMLEYRSLHRLTRVIRPIVSVVTIGAAARQYTVTRNYISTSPADMAQHRQRSAPNAQTTVIVASGQQSRASSSGGLRCTKRIDKPVKLQSAPPTVRGGVLPKETRQSIRLPPLRAEIVWRREVERESSGSQSTTLLNTSLRSAGSLRPQLAMAPTSTSIRVADPPGRAGSRGATSVSLDSATADRLAEDVIQRVERRFRIERERRGL